MDTRSLILALAALPLFAPSPAPGDESDLAAEIVKLRDEADPERIAELADFGNRAAMEGLIECYDVMGSIFMRREILLALAGFDSVPGAAEPALEKIMEIATASKEVELREFAVDALAECKELGKTFLVMIVDSPAPDMVRERAMLRHVERAEESDLEWYRTHYRPETEKKDEDKRTRRKKPERDDDADGDEGEGDLAIIRLPRLRSLAFEALAPHLEARDVVLAASDGNKDIRRLALRELHRRGDRNAEELAEERYGRVDEKDEVRIEAATILAELQGDKVVRQFIEDGRKFATPLPLRWALADILAGMDDKGVRTKLLKLVGKGKAHEKLFVLRAVRDIEDDKLVKSLRRLLADKNLDVKIQAAQILGERRDAESIKSFETMIKKAKEDELLVSVAIEALSRIHEDDEEWKQRLLEYSRGEETLVRNAAIKQLARMGDGNLDLMVEALRHVDWSTRVAALRAIEGLRDPAGIGPIVEQMQGETGLVLRRFADTLWRLTGQPFRTNARAWKGWWDRDGADFEIITPEELEKRVAEEEMRRLRQITRSSFFGIRIESHRVIFIIDVSGSMNEPTESTYVGEGGPPRIDVAKRELSRCIDSLEPGSLFNIIPFSDGVSPWLEEGVAQCDADSKEEAKTFVSRMGALGGTNLYGSLQEAFRDPDVDTIFVLSDGEPTVGDVIDPGSIREHVGLWNEHRGIVIHSIAVGGNLQVLEWLAEDNGGTHVKFH